MIRNPSCAWSADRSVRVDGRFFGFLWSQCGAVRHFEIFAVLVRCCPIFNFFGSGANLKMQAKMQRISKCRVLGPTGSNEQIPDYVFNYLYYYNYFQCVVIFYQQSLKLSNIVDLNRQAAVCLFLTHFKLFILKENFHSFEYVLWMTW